MIPFLWLLLVLKKNWWTASLLPIFGLYALTMRNYVGLHYFTRLLLFFFGLIVLVIGILYFKEALVMRFSALIYIKKELFGVMLFVPILMVVAYSKGTQF